MKAVRKTYLDPAALPAVNRTTLKRILGYLRPHRLRVAVVAASVAVAAALNLAPSWLIKRVVDDAIPRGDVMLLLLYCAGMIAGPLAAGLFQVIQKYGAERIGQDVMFDLRAALYERFQQMPFAFFASQKPGEAVSQVLNDVQGVGGVMSGTLVDIIQNALVLVSTTVFLVALDWRLALVALLFLPLFVLPTRRVGQRRKALKRGVQARMAELTGMLTETLSVSGALLIKVFGGERLELQLFREKAAAVRQLSLEQSLVGRWFRLLLGVFEATGPAVVFAAGGIMVVRGHASLGTVFAFVLLLKRLYAPASELVSVHVDLLTSYAYFDRVFEALDRVPSVVDAPDAVSLASVKGQIELRHVSFGYDRTGQALHDISLTIPAGSTVALVGPSGSGKSTIAALVARLYDPDEGAVLIDGVDLRRTMLESLHANIAIVTQETFLFHTTVLDNLRYGRPAASLAEVELAARRAQIHETIAALPDGYHTLVGERGYRFSGGERQRLALARAILKDAPILILDEATSSLDSASELSVQQGIAPILREHTNLVIAQRLSSVREADLIVVLNEGRIVEQGTHDELVAKGGLYAWLWWMQANMPAPTASSPARAGSDPAALSSLPPGWLPG